MQTIIPYRHSTDKDHRPIMKQFSLKALALSIALLAFAQTAQAISMNPFKREGRTRAQTLIISGNYREPRLIAELAQYRTKQPFLLINNDGSNGYSLFFAPHGTKPMYETVENFSGILGLINPQQIVILGNSDYVPAQFVDSAQKRFPVIVIPNADMAIVAQTLANILDQPKLKNDFLDYRNRIQKAAQSANNFD